MSSVQRAPCPRCGFPFAWDGNRCRKCHHGVEASSQGGFVPLEHLQEVLRRSELAADELVVDMFWRFLPSYSALSSAGYVLGAAGLVCSYRPHLAEQVLVRPTGYLFDLGARTADHVLCWVDSLLEARRAALSDCAESILDPPDLFLVGFTWFHPTGMNPNACLKTLLGDMVEASGPNGEGVEWLKTNLPQYRHLLQDVLDWFTREWNELHERHRREQEQQRAEAETREQRKTQGLCMRCGTPLDIWSRLFARDRHRACRSDR